MAVSHYITFWTTHILSLPLNACSLFPPVVRATISPGQPPVARRHLVEPGGLNEPGRCMLGAMLRVVEPLAFCQGPAQLVVEISRLYCGHHPPSIQTAVVH